ncbi:MAG: hypothetical protein ACYC65_13050 [Candidatus Limnocylindrales bacterium]
MLVKQRHYSEEFRAEAIRPDTARADNFGAMPKPRVLTARRPPCPKGHQGDVWLDGFYGRDEHHERPPKQVTKRRTRSR